MPQSALPEGFKIYAAGTGTDWDNPIQRWWNKGWFAYGPRATQWWAKWREFPKVLFARHDKNGLWWYENTDGSRQWNSFGKTPLPVSGLGRDDGYLSAIQYWTKWHIAIMWPFHFQLSYYIDPVPSYPNHAGNARVLYIRFGARRDADKVYWCPDFYVGLQWN